MNETVIAPRYITYVPLTDLHPAPRNPKRHALELIIDSIRLHGLVETPVADERTGRVLHGHGRREALIELQTRGAQTPDGVLLDNDGGWLIPLLRGWSSRDDAEAEALAIKLSRLPGEGGWDPREFAAVLEDLATNDAELFDSLAIPHDEIDQMLRLVDPETLPGGLREAETPTLHLSDDGGTDELSPDDAGRPATQTCPACGHHFASGR
ncbi:ParB N-terminal domain-containing protein [Streptomyces sp. NPDC091201]|uniref:ParB N-terminal domain-containing protein n=1 Tax=Streptomyces sp. NPDC091201 TaxID=3155190 RepID=UPI00343F92A5